VSQNGADLVDALIKKAAELEITASPADHLLSATKARDLKERLLESAIKDANVQAQAKAKSEGFSLLSVSGISSDERIEGLHTEDEDTSVNAWEKTMKPKMTVQVAFEIKKR